MQSNDSKAAKNPEFYFLPPSSLQRIIALLEFGNQHCAEVQAIIARGRAALDAFIQFDLSAGQDVSWVEYLTVAQRLRAHAIADRLLDGRAGPSDGMEAVSMIFAAKRQQQQKAVAYLN